MRHPVDGGFDISLQIFHSTAEALIERPLFRLRRVFCAAPEYLSRCGMPTRPADLLEHELGLSSTYPMRNRWSFSRKGEEKIWLDLPAPGEYFERQGPIVGSVASRAAAAGVKDAERAADVAQRAFANWSTVGPTERRRLLLRAGDLLEARYADFARLMLQETGATPAWAHFNVLLASNMLRDAAAVTTGRVAARMAADNSPRCVRTIVRAGGAISSKPPLRPHLVRAVPRASSMRIASRTTTRPIRW